MKKYFALIALAIGCIANTFAMSNNRIRENARFLSDRMAYELNLTTMQYEDCYEINYDFIYAVADLLDDVAYGYQDAIDRYYDFLDWRNDDLRMVLTATQFARFCALEYFYRPIYTQGRSWYFRIHQIYHNHSYYYYHVPSCYHTYHGAHSHIHHTHGFYGGRYHHEIAPRYDHFRSHSNYHNIHHGDFGHDRHDRPASHRNASRNNSYHHDTHPGNGSNHDRHHDNNSNNNRNNYGNTHRNEHHDNGNRNHGSHDNGNHSGARSQDRNSWHGNTSHSTQHHDGGVRPGGSHSSAATSTRGGRTEHSEGHSRRR